MPIILNGTAYQIWFAGNVYYIDMEEFGEP